MVKSTENVNLLFKKKEHLRYFTLDFGTTQFEVRQKKESKVANKSVSFRHFSKCYCREQLTCVLETVERKFELTAANELEMNVWLAAFNYVIVSTEQVQKLMKQNNLTD